MDLRHVSDDGDKILPAASAALENGITVLLILIGDAFDHTTKLFQDPSPAFLMGSDVRGCYPYVRILPTGGGEMMKNGFVDGLLDLVMRGR